LRSPILADRLNELDSTLFQLEIHYLDSNIARAVSGVLKSGGGAVTTATSDSVSLSVSLSQSDEWDTSAIDDSFFCLRRSCSRAIASGREQFYSRVIRHSAGVIRERITECCRVRMRQAIAAVPVASVLAVAVALVSQVSVCGEGLGVWFCVDVSVRSVTHSFIHSLILSFTYSFTYSFTHSFTHSLTLSFTLSFIHSLFHSLTHSLIHSLFHSLTHSLTRSGRAQSTTVTSLTTTHTNSVRVCE